ncbi:hypothetical protein C2S51_010339 [Perilla frutescens var. frutescens]|nr:hypothetical protein C2S51_010339 [Perilla frutescens var. frutescens]
MGEEEGDSYSEQEGDGLPTIVSLDLLSSTSASFEDSSDEDAIPISRSCRQQPPDSLSVSRSQTSGLVWSDSGPSSISAFDAVAALIAGSSTAPEAPRPSAVAAETATVALDSQLQASHRLPSSPQRNERRRS